jgi:predicted dehydrogenase
MAMATKLRLGAVGIGGIFNACHAPVWLKHPEVELVAVCDIIPAKARVFAEAHGIKHVVTDYRDLLKLDLDAIDICTPNLFHSEIAVAALQAGKHVITEKPDAINASEAARMAVAARAAGKTLMAMRNNRFTPHFQFLKQYLADGQMGDIYAGRVGWIRRRGTPGRGGWFTTKELSGGGPLIDLGVHFLDLALWLMGNPSPVTLSASTFAKFTDSSAPADSANASFGEAKAEGTFDVEDLAIGFARFSNGAALQLEFSWASNIDEETVFLELRGSKAGFNFRNWRLTLFTEASGTLVDITPKLSKLELEQHAAFLHHFVDVLRGRCEPTLRPEHGVDMIKLLTGLYASAQQGREVQV